MTDREKVEWMLQCSGWQHRIVRNEQVILVTPDRINDLSDKEIKDLALHYEFVKSHATT